MSNNALFTIEQVDNKLIITVEAVKPEQPVLPETRPMNADEIAEWTIRSLQTGLSRTDLIRNINTLVQYEVTKAKR